MSFTTVIKFYIIFTYFEFSFIDFNLYFTFIFLYFYFSEFGCDSCGGHNTHNMIINQRCCHSNMSVVCNTITVVCDHRGILIMTSVPKNFSHSPAITHII